MITSVPFMQGAPLTEIGPAGAGAEARLTKKGAEVGPEQDPFVPVTVIFPFIKEVEKFTVIVLVFAPEAIVAPAGKDH